MTEYEIRPNERKPEVQVAIKSWLDWRESRVSTVFWPPPLAFPMGSPSRGFLSLLESGENRMVKRRECWTIGCESVKTTPWSLQSVTTWMLGLPLRFYHRNLNKNLILNNSTKEKLDRSYPSRLELLVPTSGAAEICFDLSPELMTDWNLFIVSIVSFGCRNPGYDLL